MAKGVVIVSWNSLLVIKLQNDICLFIEANEIMPDLGKCIHASVTHDNLCWRFI